MNQGSVRRLLCVLFALAMAVGLLPAIGMPAHAANRVSWSENLTISKDTTISSGVTVKRNVIVTIEKGATLTVNGGIDAGTRTVSVMGEGTLVINGYNAFTGAIFVDGPTVYATGGNGGGGWCPPEVCDRNGDNGGPGGDGGSAFVGTVVIMSGSVIATGGNGGIGGNGGECYRSDTGRSDGLRPGAGGRGGKGGTGINGKITIIGGSLIATGGNGGNGSESAMPYGVDMGGSGGDVYVGGTGVEGDITVMGGSVTASGGNGGKRGKGSIHDAPDGKDGAPGKGLKGKAVGDATTVKESDDNKSWSVAKSDTSDKRYVKVALVVTD